MIFPWNPSAQDRTKLLPSSIYTANTTPSCQEPIPVISGPDINVPADDQPAQEYLDEFVFNVSHETFSFQNISPLPIESMSMNELIPTLDISSDLSGCVPLVSPQPELDMSATSSGSVESLNNVEFEPPDDQNKPHWYVSCSKCNRRILNRFIASHHEACVGSSTVEDEVLVNLAPPDTSVQSPADTSVQSPPDTSVQSEGTSDEVKLSTLPTFDLDDRKDHLEKFEVVFLKKNQVKEFEDMFTKKEFKTVKDPLYRAWLQLKFAAAGTESEAIDHQLDSKVAKNIPKRKTVRKDFRPKGPPRHDPTSPEWISVLVEQQDKQKAVKKRKLPEKPGKENIEGGKQKKGSLLRVGRVSSFDMIDMIVQFII